MFAVVTVLVTMVCGIQWAGDRLVAKLDHRAREIAGRMLFACRSQNAAPTFFHWCRDWIVRCFERNGLRATVEAGLDFPGKEGAWPCPELYLCLI